MHKFKWSKGKGMSSRTSLFTEMHLGHDTMLVCLSKLVIASNESLWATLDIWLIPYYHSSLCLEYGGMSQIFLKSYSFEVDACTPWHRIDSSKMQLACVGSVLILKIYLVLGLCDPIDPFVGEFPYKLLNGDIVVPLWAVNFGKQILVSPLWFASLVLISSTFTFLPLDLLRCACLWVQGSLPCSWSSTGATQEFKFVLEVKRRLELFCRFTGRGGLIAPGPSLTAPCSLAHQGRSNRMC
jgi:hypothetical protein